VIATPAIRQTRFNNSKQSPATIGRRYQEEPVDGRRLRAAHNRDAVVGAVIDILREQDGGPIPGAAEVAKRAGVSERTVFRHFADLDALFIAAAARQRPTLLEYLGPRPDMKELDRRISAVVRLRGRLYEEVAPVRRVAAALAEEHSSLAEVIEEANRFARDQLADVFGRELQRAGRERALVLDELELASSWPVWEALRTSKRATPERARRVMGGLISAVLGPYASRRSGSRSRQ
jgi:AcrR family transcriptional regulator